MQIDPTPENGRRNGPKKENSSSLKNHPFLSGTLEKVMILSVAKK